MSNGEFFYYSNKQGAPTNNTPEIVEQEVTILCYQYIEQNKGKRPSYSQIEQMVADSFKAMGWEE